MKETTNLLNQVAALDEADAEDEANVAVLDGLQKYVFEYNKCAGSVVICR